MKTYRYISKDGRKFDIEIETNLLCRLREDGKIIGIAIKPYNFFKLLHEKTGEKKIFKCADFQLVRDGKMVPVPMDC